MSSILAALANLLDSLFGRSTPLTPASPEPPLQPLTPRVLISALVILGSVVLINARRPARKSIDPDPNSSSELRDGKTR